MNRDSVNWSGPMPALVTPFDAQGAIDADLFRQNIDLQLASGATGFVIGGCTGEFWAMTAQERISLFQLAAKFVGGRGTVLAGVSAMGLDETIALARAAKAAGCDGALVLPPIFVKLTDDEIFSYFQKLSHAVEFPICLYNIPANAVNVFSPALCLRLAELDTVVAVKESCGDWNAYYAIAMAVRDRLRVFCGPSSVYGVAAVMLGADGVIDCFPNVWLPGGLDLYYAARDGRTGEATRLQELGVKLTRLFTSDGRTLYPATKAAMALLGLPGGELRAPLLPLTEGQLSGLREGLVALGFTLHPAAASQAVAAE